MGLMFFATSPERKVTGPAITINKRSVCINTKGVEFLKQPKRLGIGFDEETKELFLAVNRPEDRSVLASKVGEHKINAEFLIVQVKGFLKGKGLLIPEGKSIRISIEEKGVLHGGVMVYKLLAESFEVVNRKGGKSWQQ